MSINKVLLVGYVADKPEMRYFDSGKKIATIRMGTTERGYTGDNGIQIPDRTMWHTIVAWDRWANIAEKYIKKGSQIYIEGKINYRFYDTKQGKRYVTEIHAFHLELVGTKRDGDMQVSQFSNENNESEKGCVSGSNVEDG